MNQAYGNLLIEAASLEGETLLQVVMNLVYQELVMIQSLLVLLVKVTSDGIY